VLTVSVIVAATNRPATLERCTRAIESARSALDELIVIDGPAGAGPAQARNEGARRARGEVLLFVDADVEIHPDSIDRVRHAFQEQPDLDAVFGSYDSRVAAPGFVSAFRNLLHHHVHQQGAGTATTFWAGIGAIRRDRFLAAGGFDATRYPRPSIEDVELGVRLAGAGCTLVLDPELQGTHLKRWSLWEMLRTDFARRGVPWVGLLLRERTVPTALNLGWSHRLSAIASLTAAAAVPRRRPLTAGGSLLALICLNRAFYGLLVRRCGPRGAAVGVGLHALHHLAAAAAVPAGLLLHARERIGERLRAGRPG
jgi:glycosyltransferase involved in cell wall biosynthesis